MKNKLIYKFIAVLCMLCIFLGNTFAAGAYEPGITGEETAKKGEFNYKETVFLTGEPIILSGTAKITESKTSTGSKTKVEYKLANTAKNAKLDRTMTYTNKETKDKYGTQITKSISVDPNVKETVQIGSDTFVLATYTYSKSGMVDDKAIIQYGAYEWNGRKTYTRAGGGEVIIDITGKSFDYENFWGATETSTIDNTITYRYNTGTGGTGTAREAVGTVQYAVSNSKIKQMEYMRNEPVPISFKGGYVLKDNQENVVAYTYDVPSMAGWNYTDRRNKGRSSYQLETLPTQTRLFSPNIQDVSSSYWAAADIRAIAALNIISVEDTKYFRPLSYVSRAEFTRALVKAANIPEKSNIKSYQLVFDDVEKNHPYYDYIKTAVNTGIVTGKRDKQFAPDEYITKEEAATIIVRAMGLEQASTLSGSKTTFADDKDIWSKKSVNIARSMGIVKGNEDNMLEPDKLMTRAEVSEMFSQFIKYMQYDIRKEYREKLINYGR